MLLVGQESDLPLDAKLCDVKKLFSHLSISHASYGSAKLRALPAASEMGPHPLQLLGDWNPPGPRSSCLDIWEPNDTSPLSFHLFFLRSLQPSEESVGRILEHLGRRDHPQMLLRPCGWCSVEWRTESFCLQTERINIIYLLLLKL